MCCAPRGLSQTRSGCGEGSTRARRRASSGSVASAARISAAKVRAMVALPAPRGPRKRYAWEGPDASATVSATRARAWCSVTSVSGSGTDRLHHALVDLLDAAVAVDDDDAVRGDLGDFLVGLGDGALQLQALGLEAVAALGAAEAGLGI